MRIILLLALAALPSLASAQFMPERLQLLTSGRSALMTRFYDELNAGSAAPEAARQGGVDKREALRKAQLASRAQFPHPFFWAAFQLTGQAN